MIVDLAAIGGGNCELTRPDEVVDAGGVTVLGPLELAASVPHHASQMYAKNVSSFLLNLVHDGTLQLDESDPIVGEALLTRAGEVRNARVREILGMPAAGAPVGERRDD